MSNFDKSLTAAAGFSAVALLLTACGGSIADTSSQSASDPAPGADAEVVISGLVVAANAALPLAISEGVFEGHGLDVEFNGGLDAGAQLPALTTNQTQFSVCNLTSALTAIDKGLDIRIVSGFNYSKEEEPDANGVVVAADSGIESFDDLSGKVVSVPAVRSQGDLMIKEAARRAGADPEAIEFNELAFPNMQAQLELGNTDAIWLPEPFLSMAQQDDGLTTLGFSYFEVEPGSPVQMICADGGFVDENPEVVATMQAALADVAELVTEEEALLRAEIAEFTSMPKELANQIIVEDFDTDVRDSVDTINELAAEYDVIDEPVDLNAVVVSE